MEDLLGAPGGDDINDVVSADTVKSSGLDGMLAGSDDDDLFGGPPAAVPPPEQSAAPQSALIAWEREKQIELREKDAQDEARSADLKAAAGSSLKDYLAKLSEAQEKRAVHNRELDDQKMADLEATGNQWEKVVKFIDFNRSDLHQRDISKMKTLLLQLKH
jgi:uncharacterized protein with von Willebrand factor type A (vWA) domain